MGASCGAAGACSTESHLLQPLSSRCRRLPTAVFPQPPTRQRTQRGGAFLNRLHPRQHVHTNLLQGSRSRPRGGQAGRQPRGSHGTAPHIRTAGQPHTPQPASTSRATTSRAARQPGSRAAAPRPRLPAPCTTPNKKSWKPAALPTWNFSRMQTYMRSSIASICSSRFTSAMRRYSTRSAAPEAEAAASPAAEACVWCAAAWWVDACRVWGVAGEGSTKGCGRRCC